LTAYDLSIDTLDMHVSLSSCSIACLFRLHFYSLSCHLVILAD
jgi:hypothetical protein